MDTFVARFLQPTPLAVAALMVLAIAVAIAVALAVALAAGVDSIGVAHADTGPFRWA